MKKILVFSVSVSALLLATACGGGSGGDNNTANRTQRDRMGLAAVNTALVDSANKDGFNAGDPSTDVMDFRQLHIDQINGLRAAVGSVAGFPAEDAPGVSPEALVDLLVSPDVIRIDLSAPVGFPNGRRLTDDVIDPTLGLVLNRGNVLGGGAGVGDAISDDSTPLATFPYAGNPN